jgi:hypothetical protein
MQRWRLVASVAGLPLTDSRETTNSGGSLESMEEQDYPVDNATYNLLQMLVSKLEAVEAYSVYMDDFDGEALEVAERIQREDTQHVQDLLKLLGLSSKAQ